MRSAEGCEKWMLGMINGGCMQELCLWFKNRTKKQALVDAGFQVPPYREAGMNFKLESSLENEIIVESEYA